MMVQILLLDNEIVLMMKTGIDAGRLQAGLAVVFIDD